MKKIFYIYGGSVLLVLMFAPIKNHLEEWQKFLIAGIGFSILGINHFIKNRASQKKYLDDLDDEKCYHEKSKKKNDL